jgi:hypothetical protein
MSNLINTATNAARIVYTKKNTTLDKWKDVLKGCLEGTDVVFEDQRPLALKHAWEMGDTPESYASMLKNRAKQLKNKASFTSSVYPK